MPFRFVSAAVNPKNATTGIYIRHKAIQGYTSKIRVLHSSPEKLHIDCPDRELLITRDSDQMDPYTPFGDGYDEYVDLNFFAPHANVEIGFNYLMTNYTEYVSPEGFAPYIRGEPRNPGETIFVSDSGGFQLKTGTLDFINPQHTVDWYNVNTDIGLVLDLPLVHTDDELFTKSAKLQKKNTDLMLERKAPGLSLMNIFHGDNPRHRKEYREIVEDDRIDRLALSGRYYRNLVAGTDSLLTLLEESPQYKHIHVLGVFSARHLACLVRAAHYKDTKVLITSDASTHIQSAVHKTYHLNRGQQYPPKRLLMGDNQRYPSINSHLSCTCKVCRSIKYMDILGVINGSITGELLAFHNLYDTHRYANFLNDACRRNTDAVYRDLVRGGRSLKKGAPLKDPFENPDEKYGVTQENLEDALDFIEYAEKHGLKAAKRKYQREIDSGKPPWTPSADDMLPGLGGREKAKFEEQVNASMAERNRISTMLDRYEDYHERLERGEKVGGPKKEKSKRAGDGKYATRGRFRPS